MNPIDAGILIVLLAGLVIGLSRGLAGLIIDAVGYVVSVIAAFAYHDRVAIFLDESFGLASRISTFLSQRLPLPPALSALGATSLSTEQLRQFIGALRLPEPYGSSLAGYLGRVSGSGLGGTSPVTPGATLSGAQLIANTVAAALLEGLAFLLILALVSILFRLIAPLLTRFLTAITGEGLGRLAGGAIGLLMAGVTVAILLGLAAPFFAMIDFSPWTTALSSSHLAAWFLQAFSTFGPWTGSP